MPKWVYMGIVACLAGTTPAAAQSRTGVINVEEVFAKYEKTAYLEAQFETRRRALLAGGSHRQPGRGCRGQVPER